jgi:hypothetical protein
MCAVSARCSLTRHVSVLCRICGVWCEAPACDRKATNYNIARISTPYMPHTTHHTGPHTTQARVVTVYFPVTKSTDCYISSASVSVTQSPRHCLLSAKDCLFSQPLSSTIRTRNVVQAAGPRAVSFHRVLPSLTCRCPHLCSLPSLPAVSSPTSATGQHVHHRSC